MSAVNEWIVREYFELQGFLVGQPRKYVVPGRQKRVEEEMDLVVYNPTVTEQHIPKALVWTSDDLVSIKRAVIGVRGWHTERFYASTFEQTPDILRFAEADSVGVAAERLGSDAIAKILCLPRLPATGELRDKTIELLQEKGIDGVVSFRTMIAELISKVETHQNYEKSDLLQVIRVLKTYDFIKDSQMELFAGKSRIKKTKT